MRFVLTAFLVITGGCFLYIIAKGLFRTIVELFGTPVKTNKTTKKGNK